MFGVGAVSATIPASLSRAVVPKNEIVEVPWQEPPEAAPFGFADPPPKPDELDDLVENLPVPAPVDAVHESLRGQGLVRLDEHGVVTFHNTNTDEKVHLKIHEGSMAYGQSMDVQFSHDRGRLTVPNASHGPLEVSLYARIAEVVSPNPGWLQTIRSAGPEGLDMIISLPNSDLLVLFSRLVYQSMSLDPKEGLFEIEGVCYN